MKVESRVGTLALDGGRPVRHDPLPGWPAFDDDDRRAVDRVLKSGRVNYWTGDQGRLFEEEFAQWARVPHAVAVANGTLALEIALRAWGVGPGDEVIVPAATFFGTASAVVACGAVPVVVDVDRDTQCLTPATVEAALTDRTTAVVVVHLAGCPANVRDLLALTRSRGLGLIEDCAQAHGARIDERPVGTFGDLATWSFCQDKIMTTGGEGGAITSSHEDLFRRCWELKDHGKSYDAVHHRRHAPGFRWLHESFGTNARMTEVQAAVGRSQLPKVDRWVNSRRAHAGQLRDALGTLEALRLPNLPEGTAHSYYKFYAHVDPARLGEGWSRDRVIAAINAEGIPCWHGGCAEIHREKAFTATGRPSGVLPVAAELGATSLMLPVHPTLSVADVDDIAEAVSRVMRASMTRVVAA
ncbi:DegT/DnrJ/EryC1/StrS aminotransferase family protein [Saccharopolyspora aridisoli]|uniref:DegT/DnrJ/EryC1/StrS aminotransferase family protein n=1 Tax=Saccharopolyspora aridisoli TaxID=2530385 RepID=A0A4R4UT12_9PSEU|nr:DegT/DnrJ/EryC1/StrS aminotransferase family protein [Saccharopolyspora aridisoli]TDC95507.1 DegT/DnrJ/EryC1/StrS aminotransferase family protein [Saccharopolyspora aridisoli]